MVQWQTGLLDIRTIAHLPAYVNAIFQTGYVPHFRGAPTNQVGLLDQAPENGTRPFRRIINISMTNCSIRLQADYRIRCYDKERRTWANILNFMSVTYTADTTTRSRVSSAA